MLHTKLQPVNCKKYEASMQYDKIEEEAEEICKIPTMKDFCKALDAHRQSVYFWIKKINGKYCNWKELTRKQKKNLAIFILLKQNGVDLDYDTANNLQSLKQSSSLLVDLLKKALIELHTESRYTEILKHVPQNVMNSIFALAIEKSSDGEEKLNDIIKQLPIFKQMEKRE